MSNTKNSLFLSAGLLASSLVSTDAHICMWSPLQRGGAFELVIPGQSICYLKAPPCGGTQSAEPLTSLTGGSNFELLFQQNLNHFYQANPGKIVADFSKVSNPSEQDFFPLEGVDSISDWVGMNMITQTNFSLSVKIPNIDCDNCVLRLRYVSNNPTEDHGGSPTFHQCADVSVKKGEINSLKNDNKSTKVLSSSVTNNDRVKDCCAPKQFTMEGYEQSDWRNPTHFHYFFDADNQLFRIDQDSGDGLTVKDGRFQMFNDFKAGIEYYYNVNKNSCALYGLNIFYDWCYGSINHQVWHSEARVGDQAADVWGMEGNDFYFANLQNSCTPVSKVRTSKNETLHYFNFAAGNPPADFFALPTACLKAKAGYEESKHELETSPRSVGLM